MTEIVSKSKIFHDLISMYFDKITQTFHHIHKDRPSFPIYTSNSPSYSC